MTRHRIDVRALGELLPATIVAFALLPWIIAGGSAMPWRPALLDLEVYRVTVQDLLAGADIYLTRATEADLPFIYPPIAAVLMVPFGMLPSWLLQIVWTLLGLGAQWLVLKRCGVARGIAMSWAMVTLVLAVEPIRTTLGYGQVNTILMALVVADLIVRPGTRRVFPAGTWVGLAAAIKLTPLLFVAFLVFTKRWRHAFGALATFVVLTGFGALVLPAESAEFLRKVITGDMYGDPVYAGNQSLGALIDREFVGASGNPLIGLVGLAVGGVLALLATWVAARIWSTGDVETCHARRVWAIGLMGLATCLASPISWTHHHVWLVPLALGALGGAVPATLRVLSLLWSGWVAVCVPLGFLPYGEGREAHFDLLQRACVELTPVLSTVLIIWSFVWVLRGVDGASHAGSGDDTRADADAPAPRRAIA